MQQNEERYELLGKIDEGGRGAVYRAHDRQLDRYVAIKRLFKNGSPTTEESHDAIVKESHALSSINSPHIVRVFDVASDEDGPYVVMELLEGKTLHEIVKQAPLVLKDFNDVAEQSLEALIAAHEARLLHRDIKPGNLMLTWLPSGRMQLKLLDFGLAKFTEKPAVQTVAHSGSVLGSIYFMAPEQFERTALDVRSDLYSLGCVLYYALTAEYPFQGESATEVMASHIHGDCADLQPLRPDMPPAVCRWVMRMLAREMDDRPSSAQEALEEFEEAKRDPTPVSSAPVASHPRLITSLGSETASQLVNTAAHTATQVVPALSNATGQVPTHTTSTTPILSATSTQPVHARSSSIPPWIFAIGGTLVLCIVALGVAMAMRGDPGKGIPPPNPAPPPEEAAANPDPGPNPQPASGEDGSKTISVPQKDEEQPPEKPKWNASQDFKKKDRDGDFQLSAEEFVVSRKEPFRTNLVKRFNQLDKDGDGYLTLAEFKHWKKQGGSGKQGRNNKQGGKGNQGKQVKK